MQTNKHSEFVKLLLASTNRGKLGEMQALLGDLPVCLLLPADIGLNLEVVEDGLTYAENAAIKARAYCEASGLPVLADDSGLDVDALNGAPGIHSARYAPWECATDADRRRLLLENLKAKPRPWIARFRCAIALAAPGRPLAFSEGICDGEIIPEERGNNGFGYDPIFLLRDMGKTMAELSMAEKNQRSHRALAIKAALPEITAMLGLPG
ncbi:MAG TPA: RdgB/HAM1 family non-canonical purine NTP pyrophosphatase [Anaerolineaceae bacterium]